MHILPEKRQQIIDKFRFLLNIKYNKNGISKNFNFVRL